MNRTYTYNDVPRFSYNDAVDFIAAQNRQEWLRKHSGIHMAEQILKAKRKSSLRLFRVIVDDGRDDFTVSAKTISSAFNRALRRVGFGHIITVDGGDRVLTGSVTE
jgi:hypothetical protein